MSKIGGYKIIDVSSVDIDESANTKVEVPGIYDRIEETLKPILLSGIKVKVDSSVVELGDAFIQPVVSSTDFVFSAYGFDFTVTDDDEIYYTAAVET